MAVSLQDLDLGISRQNRSRLHKEDGKRVDQEDQEECANVKHCCKKVSRKRSFEKEVESCCLLVVF